MTILRVPGTLATNSLEEVSGEEADSGEEQDRDLVHLLRQLLTLKVLAAAVERKNERAQRRGTRLGFNNNTKGSRSLAIRRVSF